jgi:polyhydroxyalkanoate synthesis regulator phasin
VTIPSLPDTSEAWEALRGNPIAVHLAVAEHLNITRVALNLSSLSDVYLHAGATYDAVARAMRPALEALMDGNSEHARRLDDELIRSGESVADTMRRVRADIHTQIQAEHDDAGESNGEDAGEVCDECLRTIPSHDGGGLANRHHAPNCSLYDPSRR